MAIFAAMIGSFRCFVALVLLAALTAAGPRDASAQAKMARYNYAGFLQDAQVMTSVAFGSPLSSRIQWRLFILGLYWNAWSTRKYVI